MAATDLFRIGLDILKTTISGDSKTVLLQLGNVAGQGLAETDTAESWQHDGFVSLPPTASAGKAASQSVSIVRGGRWVTIATRDLRGQKLAASLQPGETCLYAAGSDGTGQARILLKANGNVAIYTAQGNADGGSPVTIQANASDGSIFLANQYGAIAITSDGIKIMFGSSGIQLDSNGVTLIGQALALNGGSVALGANAQQPAIYGPSGVAGAPSTSVKIAV